MNTGNNDNPRNPLLAVDAIVEHGDGIVLIRRKNPPEGWALPGGFVEYGETVEEAVCREIREETGLVLKQPRQWRVFSDPDRDPRQHVASVVFVGRGEGTPSAATDAAEADVFDLDGEWPELAFDHEEILEKYWSDRPRQGSDQS